MAAMHFAGLIVMMPLDRTMFGGSDLPMPGCVLFLAAYA